MVINRPTENGLCEVVPVSEDGAVLSEAAEKLAEIDEEILMADGFDAALIGWTDSWSGSSRVPRAVYSVSKCVSILMSGGATSYEEAMEYLEFNTLGAYVGERTPVFVHDLEE